MKKSNKNFKIFHVIRILCNHYFIILKLCDVSFLLCVFAFFQVQQALQPSVLSLAGTQALVINAETLSQLQQQSQQQQLQQPLLVTDAVSAANKTVVMTSESNSDDFHLSTASPELRITYNAADSQVQHSSLFFPLEICIRQTDRQSMTLRRATNETKRG